MSAAHLVNYYPSLAPLGVRKRSQAWISLQRDLNLYRLRKSPGDEVLMNLMLLGLSSSWHQASHLGMQYLSIARNLLCRQIEEGSDGTDVEFFQKGLIYWEMLVSFVDPVPIAAIPGRLSLAPPEDPRASPNLVMPHPWTGIVTEVHFAMAEIGRILRRQRVCGDVTAADGVHLQEGSMTTNFDVDWATDLEKFLHCVKIPPISLIGDFDDKRTSKDDLVRVASAYRLVGLLEIYGIFPHLLQQHVQNGSVVDGFHFGHLDYGAGKEGLITNGLRELAQYVLYDIIKPITIQSGSSRLLPLVYVIVSSHLRFSDTDDRPNMTQDDDGEIQPRTLIEERMLQLSRKYPQRPHLQMLDIIREVWNRLDDGNVHVHWIDIVHKNGMQTLMG